MTPADALGLTDEQLVALWTVKPPSVIAAECGLTPKQKQYLHVRVARLRRQGWLIRRWPSGCKYTSETASGRKNEE